MAEPVALVLEKVGASNPEVEPFTELSPPLRIALPTESKLVFFHYSSCETVQIHHSVVQFTEKEYEVVEGAKEVIREGPCPLLIRCSQEGGCETAAIVLRGLQANPHELANPVGSRIHLAPLPLFIVVGKRAREFEKVLVSQGAHLVLEGPILDHRFQWPIESAPLMANTEYELTIIPRSTMVDPIHVTFTVTDPPEETHREEVVLLRID
jgi:hypothetical protein